MSVLDPRLSVIRSNERKLSVFLGPRLLGIAIKGKKSFYVYTIDNRGVSYLLTSSDSMLGAERAIAGFFTPEVVSQLVLGGE